MKKISDYPWITRVMLIAIIIMIVISRWLDRSDELQWISTSLFLAFVLTVVLDKLLQTVTVYRKDTKGMSFVEALVSLRAAQFDYPGRLVLMIIELALLCSMIGFALYGYFF